MWNIQRRGALILTALQELAQIIIKFFANCNTESARRGGYNVLVEELYPKQLGFQG